MYFYEPPSDCRDIPDSPVPEWGLCASLRCLLPNIDYDPSLLNQRVPEDDRERNIGASYHCRGSLLTFSFQVINPNEIRCYLYWNGMLYMLSYLDQYCDLCIFVDCTRTTHSFFSIRSEDIITQNIL